MSHPQMLERPRRANGYGGQPGGRDSLALRSVFVGVQRHRTPLRVKGVGRSHTPTSLGGRRTQAPRRHKREPSTRSAVHSLSVFGKCRMAPDPWRAGGTSPAVVRSYCYPSGRGREVRRTQGETVHSGLDSSNEPSAGVCATHQRNVSHVAPWTPPLRQCTTADLPRQNVGGEDSLDVFLGEEISR